MEEKWCCDILQSLKIRENRINALQEIRNRLNQMSNLEVAITNTLLKAPEIYDCVEELDASCSERLDLASDILSMCMSNLSIDRGDLSQLLKRSISHPTSRIRSLALKTILRELKIHAGDDVSIDDDIIIQVLKAVQDDDISVGAPAIEILSISLERKLDKNFVKEGFLQALKSNAVIKCRIFEVAVKLAKRSPETMQKVDYILDYALSELDNDDVLVQVNIIEILVSLAEQDYGLLFLEQRRVFEALSRRVETLADNPLDRLLIPAIMKFFGKIATLHPRTIIEGYPHMISCLFECLDFEDTSILPTAFDTLANLVKKQEGKFLLEARYPKELGQVFEKFSANLRSLPSDLKKRAFETLEVIFSSDGDITAELSNILRRWFGRLSGGTNMHFLMDFCRNPFPDIKVACFSFIKAVCYYDWGVVALKETAGFVEYLLDRRAEFNTESKYAKYEIVKLLAESTSVFDARTQLQLQTYVNEGPYYMQSSLEIAMESN